MARIIHYAFIAVLIILIRQNAGAYPGKVVKSFPLKGKFCTGLTFDGNHLWIADYKADSIFETDPASGVIIRGIASPGFWPMGLAWDGHFLWNADRGQRKIFKIEPEDGTIVAVIDAPCDYPEGLAWDGTALWVGDAVANTIMKIDLNDGTAVKKIDGPARSVTGLTYDGRYLWSSDRNLNEIYMIDPESGEVIIMIDSPGPYSRGLAYDGNYLWNADSQTDSLYMIIRSDNETYRLKDTRKARVTFTHQVKVYGQGELKSLDVFIALPGNMPQQKIIGTSFSPGDYTIKNDSWIQPVAIFNYEHINSDKTIQSVMVTETELSDIRYFIFPERVGSLQSVPPDIMRLYTANGTKYITDDPYIQKLAKEITGEETNPYRMARKIFNYVRSTLEYKLEGGWNAAPVVLQRGTGSCSEYTFSFIALCRAAGIPARYVGSLVVRGDDASLDDVFHRWPEVYLPNYGWVSFDPQGGDKPLPRDQAMNIGNLPNRFLITTQGGGDSEYLGWYYNSNEKYQTDPQVILNIEAFGEWEPLK